MEGKIKELTNINDFKKVYTVFSEPPYNEKYTNEELEEIFYEYSENGYMYGVYNKENCVGLIALEIGAKQNQPVKFQDEKIMYLADVAVLNEYRKNGLGNQLMLYAVMQSKALGYNKLYMRTLKEGSMSYGIASKIGFKEIPNIIQNVERERVNGEIESLQNIFLEIDLDNLKKENLLKGIKMFNLNNNKEKNERN